MDFAWLFLIFFAAAFTQGLSGFGFALLSMPLVVMLFGIEYSSPLVALAGLAVMAPLLYRYRTSLNLQAVWRLAAGALIAIPVGVASIGRVESAVLRQLLGITLISYAIYTLMKFRLPQLTSPHWAFGFGFLSGLLGGAFNSSGPPVIVYADVSQWDPPAFKANLQAYFLFVALTVTISHALSANYTPALVMAVLVSLPASLIGMWSGARLSDHMPPATFRKIILVLLIMLGIQLLV